MNFLAHLHIAEQCQSSALGNLLGDFVKGNPDEQFERDIASGIRLHRFVDSYIDTHELMTHAKAHFLGRTRRFSGIALDMFWDHCLAANWHQYHHQTLTQFCQQAQHDVRASSSDELPSRFLTVTNAMWQGRWLESYQHLENIEYALQRMSTRTPRMAPLDQCFDTLEAEYTPLMAIFEQLYPDVLNAAKRF